MDQACSRTTNNTVNEVNEIGKPIPYSVIFTIEARRSELRHSLDPIVYGTVQTYENPGTPVQSSGSNGDQHNQRHERKRERERCDLGAGGARLRRRRGRRGGRGGRGPDVRAGRVYVEGLEEEQHAAARHTSLV